jgi:hypothetical protein
MAKEKCEKAIVRREVVVMLPILLTKTVHPYFLD